MKRKVLGASAVGLIAGLFALAIFKMCPAQALAVGLFFGIVQTIWPLGFGGKKKSE